MRLLAFVFIVGAVSGLTHAGDGDLSEEFGTDAEYPGIGFYLNPLPDPGADTVVAPLPAADGRLYLVGNMETGTSRRASIYRLHPNGLPDYDFGTAGLRTYQMPCPTSIVGDAEMDSQGRIWLLFRGCGDFVAYRFNADGDLDTSLLGSGVLTIAFDEGDTNSDDPFVMAIDGSDGILIAGRADAEPNSRLAVAHYTVDGLPQAGFGTDGKTTLGLPYPASSIDGVHRMVDGRIVVTGNGSPNPILTRQIVVRLQASGAADAGFGNAAPGISVVEFAELLGETLSVDSFDSLLLEDGSILQMGHAPYGEPWADWDVALIKWQPDGQLDTGFAPNGLRLYGLDFAGPTPVEADHNFDRPTRIVRQGDGSIVIAGYSRAADGFEGVSLLRLTPGYDPDPTFGVDGKIRHLIPISTLGNHYAIPRAILVQPGRILVAADIRSLPSTLVQGIVAVRIDLLFANSFD